jgi:hypothetical protein
MAISALLPASYVQAQAGVELEDVRALVQFGEQITFLATVKSSRPIQDIAIVISDELLNTPQLQPVTLQPDGRTEFHLDPKQNGLRPFSRVQWNYQFTFQDGSTARSESYFVRYTDDRFYWQTLESDGLRVNWYEGQAGFGQAALEAARAGLKSIGDLLPVALEQPVEIFIYANTADLQGTLSLGATDWVAGHADPALGVAMLTIEPGADQGIRMEQRIPHELMHVMLYRRLKAGYRQVPAWLREGMATLAEVYPNADYDRALGEAAAGTGLIPLQDLCQSFPAEAGPAFLAYAESRSFTNYLHQTYGSTGLLDLLAAYSDGVECTRGPEHAFGTPLVNLESRWRSSVLGQNIWLAALQNISPYLVLLCLVLMIPLVGMAGTLRKKRSRKEPETYVRK